MQEAADMELLLEYARRESEDAFATLVQRHVNLVYSAALRKTGNSHAAEEVTQAVFILLARKAARLRKGTVLSGWLYQAARLTSSSFLRTEVRRVRREQEACMEPLANETESAVWRQLAPMLEDAMGKLSDKERNAIALRFFEGKGFQEIGRLLGASENAAKKRVGYGLEKLRAYFARRGVVSTTAIIAAAISAHSVQAAPVGLAKTVSALAAAKGAAASASTLTLMKGALKLMAWTKTKTAILAGAIAIALPTSTVVGVKLVQAHNANESPSSGLSLTRMDQLYTVGLDGSVNADVTVQENNSTRRTVRTETINDLDERVRVTDASGRPVKVKKLPRRGVVLTFNEAVPPGQKIAYTVKTSLGNLFKATPSGEYVLETTHQFGNEQDMQLVEVWRLPAGATLATKNPPDMTSSVNGDGQIEVRLEKVVPPNGRIPLALGYRLP